MYGVQFVFIVVGNGRNGKDQKNEQGSNASRYCYIIVCFIRRSPVCVSVCVQQILALVIIFE